MTQQYAQDRLLACTILKENLLDIFYANRGNDDLDHTFELLNELNPTCSLLIMACWCRNSVPASVQLDHDTIPQ
jgi:hypothetical protein